MSSWPFESLWSCIAYENNGGDERDYSVADSFRHLSEQQAILLAEALMCHHEGTDGEPGTIMNTVVKKIDLSSNNHIGHG